MNYQIIYQDRSPQTKLLNAVQCGALFNPPLDAAAFKCWAIHNDCPPDGGVVVNGVLEPAWTRGRVRLRRESVRIATNRKMRRWKAKQAVRAETCS